MNKKINKNYNIKFNKISKYFNPNKEYTMEFLDDETIIFLNKQKKIIKAKYKFYGLIKDNQMIWSSSVPLVKMKIKNIVKDIRKKKDLFYQDYVNTQNEDSYFFYSVLDNDMTLINDNDMIEKINKLILYLSDDLFIFNPINSKQAIQLITLDKILEIYK